MEFRPCIDIHNGKVKQIVGGTLADENNLAQENFVSRQGADFYGRMYQREGIKGGHVILLNPESSSYYEDTKAQAIAALNSYPEGLQVGGGITAENGSVFLEAGASHVIVTSYVFKDGRINEENLQKLVKKIGKKRLVLDLSCRRKREPETKEGETASAYFVVTDRWQKFTDVQITPQVLEELSQYCDEFLVHAVDVEGKASGIEGDLVELLGKWQGIPVTYAGGVGSFEDLKKLKELGRNRLNVTIGSALDLFGGHMKYEEVLDYIYKA